MVDSLAVGDATARPDGKAELLDVVVLPELDESLDFEHEICERAKHKLNRETKPMPLEFICILSFF